MLSEFNLVLNRIKCTENQTARDSYWGTDTIVTLHEEQLFNMNSRIAWWCFLAETGAAAMLRKCQILFIPSPGRHFQEKKTPLPSSVSLPVLPQWAQWCGSDFWDTFGFQSVLIWLFCTEGVCMCVVDVTLCWFLLKWKCMLFNKVMHAYIT